MLHDMSVELSHPAFSARRQMAIYGLQIVAARGGRCVVAVVVERQDHGHPETMLPGEIGPRWTPC